MKKKYYNEAVIGNDKILASFSSKGEMLRVYYPSRDTRQFLDEMFVGIKVNDSMLINLHDDINNQYEQYYTEDTNILNTKIRNTYFNIEILQTDFVPISKNVLIKKYTVKNKNTINLDLNFLLYSNLLSNFNNMVGTKIEDNIFMQYSHDYTYSIFSKSPILSYKLNNSKEEIKQGSLQDKDYIGMANDSGVSYDIGKLKPGETKEFEIFIYINTNSEKYQFDDIIKDIEKIRKIDIKKELKETEKYWKNYVKEHDGLGVFSNKEKWQKLITGKKEISKNTLTKYLEMRNIYSRSILLFPLLSNSQTGGISAALEVDEERDKCGRYVYCWPRDAVFVTKALDLLKMKEETTKFYNIFSKNTQSKNGMWEQRFYTDGRLAPCWGYQIDETASIIYGVYEHYKIIKDKEFLQKSYTMCKKAAEYLKKYIDYVVDGLEHDERFVTHESYDLWEMHEGIHLYSLSTIYAAFTSMIKIEKELNIEKKIKGLDEYAKKTKEYSLNNLYNADSKILKRSNKDNVTDISMLGTMVPFNMLEQEQLKNTVEKMDMSLKTYTGGYVRFENDNYLGGNNPWIIATLWMSLYNMKIGKGDIARKQIEFTTKTATEHGFLAEQVDNEKMQAKWVIGLGWSHAMYIIALAELNKMK